MKYFRMSYEEVVFSRSYINIMLLNKSIPYDRTREKDRDDNLFGYDEETPSEPKKSRKNSPMVASDFFMQFM